jgi:hypothetical protein
MRLGRVLRTSVDRVTPDLLDEDTADRMLGGLVTAADAPPGYAPVAVLLAIARGDVEPESDRPYVAVRRARGSHYRMRLVALLAAVGLVLAAGASYADVMPVSTASIRQAVNTMLEQSPPPVAAGATHWQTRYQPGAEPASVTGSCRPVRDLGTGALRLSCPDAASSAVVRYAFAVQGARAGVPTFAVETGRTASGLLRTSISPVTRGRLVLTVRVKGKGAVDIRSVSIGFYGRG